MTKHMNMGLRFIDWPTTDHERFSALSKSTDIFDEVPWSRLSATSVRNRRYGYGQWLRFIKIHAPDLLNSAPELRVNLDTVRLYVGELRRNCTETAVAINIQRLRLTVLAIAPGSDWAWLQEIERRIANAAKPLHKPRVLSADLYQVGVDLIQDARNKAEIFEHPILSQAEQFRDGLMIAMLAAAPMRRACLASLRLEEHVVKIGNLWNIFIPAEMTKTGEDQDYDLSASLGNFLDEYIERYRPIFPGADQHGGLWPYGNRPMTDKMVRRYICKHTAQRLGIAVSPHGFRRGSATFIAEADPANIRMAKDLLGHKSFAMTEKHYINTARSRLAGQALAELVEKASSQ